MEEFVRVADDEGMGKRVRLGYPSDVTDEEGAFVAPYLALCKQDAEQREYPLRDVFNGLRYIAKTGSQWRFMPNDFPLWEVVYQQMRRWIDAQSFETMVEDLRILLREFAGRKGQPTAMILDSRTLQSTPNRCARGGYDGAKRRKGSKVHAAVDTLGHLLALHVTAADEQDRAQVEKLAETVQEITGENIELAYVDQGYTGENAAQAAEKYGVRLEVVKHTEVKRGFVLLPRRWVVERSFAWVACFRRLARDYERLAKTLAALHYLTFAILMLANLARKLAQS
jgi:transposase